MNNFTVNVHILLNISFFLTFAFLHIQTILSKALNLWHKIFKYALSIE